MMLRQVLQEIESAQGPLTLDELSRKLGVEKSTLAGMIDFWVRKRRLKGVEVVAGACNCLQCDVYCPAMRSGSPTTCDAHV
jgi:hypothetical protein